MCYGVCVCVCFGVQGVCMLVCVKERVRECVRVCMYVYVKDCMCIYICVFVLDGVCVCKQVFLHSKKYITILFIIYTNRVDDQLQPSVQYRSML